MVANRGAAGKAVIASLEETVAAVFSVLEVATTGATVATMEEVVVSSEKRWRTFGFAIAEVQTIHNKNRKAAYEVYPGLFGSIG
jgi:hypothetical protein